MSGYGWNNGDKNGGYSLISAGYLAGFAGPVLERDFPYSMVPVDDVPSNYYKVNKPYRVTDIIAIPEGSQQEIKSAILNYGGVSTSIYQDFGDLTKSEPSYYNKDNRAAYYYPGELQPKLNHRVLVIGWDDNYSLQNFNPKNRPKHNVAWLVKNSTGLGYCEDGFMWVSYEDRVMFKDIGWLHYSLAIKNAEPVDSPDDIKIYQHDEYGAMYGFFGYESPLKNKRKLEVATVYDFDDEYSYMDSVMISSINEGARYKMYYVPMCGDELVSDRRYHVLIGSGTLGHKGYITLKPDVRVKLPKGKGGIMVSIEAVCANERACVGCDLDLFNLLDKEVRFAFKSKSCANTSFEYIYDAFYPTKYHQGGLINLSIKVVAKKK